MMSVISIEEARELLGDEAKIMTDDQIERLIIDLEVIARYALKQARQELTNKVSEA